MKRVYTILAALLITVSVFAQTPQRMTYQAVVRDASNNLVTNTQIGIEINILQGSTSGTQVYTETLTPTTNENGLFTVEFGGQTGFDTISWARTPYFIETNIDLNGGTVYTVNGVSELLSVPYALHAKTAESLSGHYVGELYGGGIVFFVTPDGQHGLIASLDDLDGGSGVAWSGNASVEIGTAAQSMTDGVSNTVAIINQDATADKAATLCESYAGGGFNDWYLPSSRELYLLSVNDVLIDKILDNDGDPNTNGLSQENFAPNYGAYWSSTERDNIYAWVYAFPEGRSGYYNKASAYKVRAIRAF